MNQTADNGDHAENSKFKEEMQRLNRLEAPLLKAPDQQISLTDPDARSMKTRVNARVRHNVQTAVEARRLSDLATPARCLAACEVLLEVEGGRVAQVPSAMGVAEGGVVVTAAIRGIPRPSREGDQR